MTEHALPPSIEIHSAISKNYKIILKLYGTTKSPNC